MARVDYDRMAAQYEDARALPLAAIAPWRIALAGYLPPRSGLPVLDVGSGTGLFSFTLAEWFDVDVVGLEPSAGMRREARVRRSHARVSYLGGEAERIPLQDGCCGVAWLSTVIHHIVDLGRCAGELRRVLHPEGRVLIRSAFPGRHDAITLFRFFPEAGRVAETFPSVEETVQAFAAADFELEALESVSQVSAASLHEFRERVRLRADTTLEALSEVEFQRGMEALDSAVEAEGKSRPVVDRLDLLVLRSGRR